VGLREGRLVFDLPAAEVTRERLAQLYAQHEHELVAPAAAMPADEPDPVTAPVVMHCR
jgi:phosphonate transport system ATP-binding protein